MPSVAEQLRAGRERQKLTVAEAADATKIKSDHIRALEAGQWKTFTAPVYLRGFIRNYAGYLRLEVPQLMRELEAELVKSRHFPETSSLSPPAPGPLDFVALWLSRLKWRLILPIVLIAGVVWGIFYAVNSYRTRPKKDPLNGLSGGMYRTRPGLSSGTLPVPTNLPPASGRNR